MPTHVHVNRRYFLAASTAALAASAWAVGSGEEDRPKQNGIGLGFSLYGMKSLSIKDALAGCSELGYDCVELALMPDFHADPQKLGADDRQRLRDDLAASRLRIAGLMENLVLLADEPRHKENLSRLKLAGEFAHDLAPKQTPPVETVLGGKPAEWETTKDRMIERLASWAKTAEAARIIVAIKGHVGNAAHLPEHVAWLVKGVGSP